MRTVLILSLLTLTSCEMVQLALQASPDNPLEEWVEDEVYDYTGAKVDITGDSPE